MLRSIFWSLPHDFRRQLFKHSMPSKFNELQAFRRAGPESEYSLKPFDDTKSIFIHIPKCAGTSLAKSLYGRRVGNKDGSHVTAGWCQLTFDKETYDSYFKFTFVRNPWDRLLSAYRFVKAGGMGGRSEPDRIWSDTVLARYSSFDDFVKRWLTEARVTNTGDGPGQTRVVFAPQYRFICLRDTKIPAVDFIGTVENIKADFEHIAKKIGARAQLDFLNVSNTAQGNYVDEYTEESRAIVGDVYRTDIKLFGYDFEQKNAQER